MLLCHMVVGLVKKTVLYSFSEVKCFNGYSKNGSWIYRILVF